jgi:glyoxylase-like metal-dependent hydrolase (beta-lactamase superfamily II)
MFGVVPKVVWNRNVPCDVQNRIRCGHNCLLLERRPDDINLAGPAGGQQPHRVLIEAGSGDKFDAKNRAIFGLTDEWIGPAIEAAGVRCNEIDDVVVSHLHFDHAGGVVRRARDGEAPDWVPPGADPKPAGVKLTFPRAPIHVQRREWEDALLNRSVMTRTYFRENLEPIRDRVKLLDSPPPFPDGYLPGKEEAPPTSLGERMTEILPGIGVFRVPGHTWGQQAVCFQDERGRTVVFTPDVLPTLQHAGTAYNLAYDVEPYISSVTRRWFLQEAVKGDWLLVLDHEPGNPCCRVREDGKGWYRLEGDEKPEIRNPKSE